MTLTQQLHHIILTSYTNAWQSLKNIITSFLFHTQTHDTLSQQHHHIIITLYTNTWHSLINIITSYPLYTQTHDTQSATSSHDHHFTGQQYSQKNGYIFPIHTQTHDTHSTTSSHHPHFINKDTTLNQQHHKIILTSYTNTWHSLSNIITLSSIHTKTHDTHSTTSSHYPHFIHKHMTLTQQHHH